MADVRVLVANNLKHFRKALNLSQFELAEKMECSPTLIGKIETMKRFPSADNLNRMAEALKIAPAELFSEAETSEVVRVVAAQQKRKSQLKSHINKAIDEFFM